MTNALRLAYLAEMSAADAAAGARQTELAFHHLERAHILGQRHTSRHVRVHWRMLRLGAGSGNRREVFGQVSRILAAALFSCIWVPAGNTGRANVSALRPMPIPEDLRSLLEEVDD